MFRLTLRVESPIPLELDGVTPDRVRTLSAIQVAKLPVFHGNRREELGAFFEASGDPAGGSWVIAGDCSRVKGIGAGMVAGTIRVHGNVGLHAGAGMTGGGLQIGGDAGEWRG